MKITKLSINNFLGIRHMDIEPATPVTIFVGPNGAGKSSIAEAIRMALTGEHVREKLKKHLPNMVTEGQKDGAINLVLSNDDGWQEYIVDVSKGKISPPPLNNDFLPYVLDPPRFTSLPANERKQTLLDLIGCHASKDEVNKRLIERGCDEAKVERILPLLRAGFEAAHIEAKDQTKESRGAWRGVTGEVYGAKKAETWTVAVPQINAGCLKDVNDELAEINTAIKKQLQELGGLRSDHQKSESLKNEIDKLMPAVTDITNLETTAEIQVQNVARQHNKVARLRELASGTPAPQQYECPACNATLMWSDGDLRQYAHEGEEPNAEAKAALPAQVNGLKTLGRSMENTQQRLADARKAKLRVNQIKEELVGMPDYGKEIAKLEANIPEAEERQRVLKKETDEFTKARRIADEADQKTEAAAQHHADVLAWAEIADALSPSGIPSEILSGVMRPVNERLHESARVTGWMVPTIDSEMEIHADGRPYRLLSESERWRVDAMIAEAISYLSGLKMLVLDRFDVLDLPSRTRLIIWLADLAKKQEMETALLFGTLKALPAGLPGDMTAHWIEQGRIKNNEKAA